MGQNSSRHVSEVGLCRGLPWTYHSAFLGQLQALGMPPHYVGCCQACFQNCISCEHTLVQLQLHLPMALHTNHFHVCFLRWCRKFTEDSSKKIRSISKKFCKIWTSGLLFLSRRREGNLCDLFQTSLFTCHDLSPEVTYFSQWLSRKHRAEAFCSKSGIWLPNFSTESDESHPEFS